MSQALKLHEKLKFQVKTELKITHEILLTLHEFDLTQSYRELGYSSLYTYLVQGHGYSEGAANRRIQAARLLRQCPQAAVKIEEGKLTLTQLALAQSAIMQEEKKSATKITLEKKQKTLENLEGKNHFETQKILVETFPQFEISQPKAVPTKNRTVQAQLEFNEEDWQKIQSLLAHISHKIPDQKLESALIYWANQIEKKNQKISESVLSEVASEKKVNSQNANANSSTPAATCTLTLPPMRRWKSRRRYISLKIKRRVLQQAKYQCEYHSPLSNERCTSSHYLDIDHIRPLALGGSDEPNNLRALCRSHNQLMAKQMHLISPS